jgi:glycolate oxidase FAD binding subunit
MPMDADSTAAIREQVMAAQAAGSALRIVGGGSKQFYGREVGGAELHVGSHRGILTHDPAELVLTARAGTPLSQVEAALAAAGQALPFEPPHFGPGATLGGTIACGIAGPARAYAGAVKDYVLGVTLMSAEGKTLRFGGQVMKNVAGYDIARATVGSLGTLGVILEVSMKVLPRAPQSATRVFELDAAAALMRMSEWAGKASCISATCWWQGRLYVRSSGSEAAVQASIRRLGGEALSDAEAFWASIREQAHPFFAGAHEVVRVAVPALTPPASFAGEPLMEWGGAQRWFADPADAQGLRAAAQAAGGFGTYFRTRRRDGEVFHPLPAVQMRLQASIKSVFDPHAIFNRGRIYGPL